MNIDHYTNEAINLLKKLIATPSFSGEETAAVDIVQIFLADKGYYSKRHKNNIWAYGKHNKPGQKTILLNSHLDTVKPVGGWTYNPFTPTIVNNHLYGLGSNDASGCVVAQLMAFLAIDEQGPQSFNLIYSATAEEESSGINGIESIKNELGHIDLAIVGEPTGMQMAIAEKGLMVLECTAHGKAGHAGRNEGENAIYNALRDIEWFRTYKFEKESNLLGNIKMSVTQINAGYQHNIVPDTCSFVVDVRVNENYTNREVFEEIKKHVQCEVHPLSFRLNSSIIATDHPLVKKGISLGLAHYASPTTSDQAVMGMTSIKIGPGDSSRSHTANEYIEINELKQGIDIYFKLLDKLII